MKIRKPEKIGNLGAENLDPMFPQTFTVPQKKVEHSFKNVVGIVFFVVLAGNDKQTEIADLAVNAIGELSK